MVAALTRYGETARDDRLYDAWWLLITAVAAALAHGYAHTIARRGGGAHPGVLGALRVLADEWPLVVATLPTTVLLLGAGWGGWRSLGIEYVAFGLNIALLFAWGLSAAQSGPARRGPAPRVAGEDRTVAGYCGPGLLTSLEA
jgi:hypothetical protein